MSDNRPEVSICRWLGAAPFAYSMTYDEGTLDCLANALPIHNTFGFPGHVDVVAGQLGRQRNAYCSSLNEYVHMSADELRFLIDRGWGVGNHSWSHYVYPLQPGLDLWREVVWSKYRLEDELGIPVRIFTIPNDTHNYAPVIDLVKQHYAACAYIEGGPNREGFDLYKIGNCMVAAGAFRPRPGWPQELKTENLTLDFVRDSWLYETSHLCLWNVPQTHKCVTPQSMTQRFEKIRSISQGRVWAAKPDDVIDYVLLRRSLRIAHVQHTETAVSFSLDGTWPVGVVEGKLTFRISGHHFSTLPEVTIAKDTMSPALRQNIHRVELADGDCLVTADALPGRTFAVRFAGERPPTDSV